MRSLFLLLPCRRTFLSARLCRAPGPTDAVYLTDNPMSPPRYKSRARTGELRHVSAVVEDFLRRRQMRTRSKQHLCASLWPEIVGPISAEVSHVSHVRRGTAYIACEGAAWAHALQLQEEHILHELEKRLGERYVKKLHFSSTGRTPKRDPRPRQRPSPKPTSEELEREPLPEQDREAIEALVDKIEPGDVRQSLRAVLTTERRAHRWRLRHDYHPCASCGTLIYGPGVLCFPCERTDVPPQAELGTVHEGDEDGGEGQS